MVILNLNESSISLGTTSKALSMNQKVLLMLDTKLFDKSDKKYIEVFMSIRNQFMHNVEVQSFESCFSFLNGTENFLKKEFLRKKQANEMAGGERAAKEKVDEEINNKELHQFAVNDNEKHLYKCWISLAEDVLISFGKVLDKVKLKRALLKLV